MEYLVLRDTLEPLDGTRATRSTGGYCAVSELSVTIETGENEMGRKGVQKGKLG